MAPTRKRPREWQKPYTAAENLKGACTCLESTVGAVRFFVNLT